MWRRNDYDVITEAKPRTLRKRRPASQPVVDGRGRAIAAIVGSIVATTLPCLLETSIVYLHA